MKFRHRHANLNLWCKNLKILMSWPPNSIEITLLFHQTRWTGSKYDHIEWSISWSVWHLLALYEQCWDVLWFLNFDDSPKSYIFIQSYKVPIRFVSLLYNYISVLLFLKYIIFIQILQFCTSFFLLKGFT